MILRDPLLRGEIAVHHRLLSVLASHKTILHAFVLETKAWSEFFSNLLAVPFHKRRTLHHGILRASTFEDTASRARSRHRSRLPRSCFPSAVLPIDLAV